MDEVTRESFSLQSRDREETDSIFDLLLKLPIFQGLGSGELRTLEPYFKVMDLQAEETLFQEGALGNYVCFVVKGALDVLKGVETGADVVLTTIREGSSIGEMSIIDEFSRSATVKARTDATLVILTRTDFEHITSDRPELGFEILKGLAGLLSMNLRKTSARLAEYMPPLS